MPNAMPFPPCCLLPWTDKRAIALAVLMLYTAGSAVGQQTDVLTPSIAVAVGYDDNVLGLPSDVTPAQAGIERKADVTHTIEAGLRLEKRIGLQSIKANARAASITYDNLKTLNHLERELEANWNWALGRQFEGNLGMEFISELTPFADFHELALNTRTRRRESAGLDWHLHPSFRLHAGVARYRVAYDLAAERSADRQERRVEVGAGMTLANGNALGLQLSRTVGSYPGGFAIGAAALPNGYVQDEIKLIVDWHLTAKTRLQLQAGQTRRTQPDLRQRDFHGPSARLDAEWLASGHTSLTAALWREVGSVDDLDALYSVNTGVRVAPLWRPTDKLSIETRIQYEQRDFGQSLAGSALALRGLKERYRGVGVTARYTPLRHTLVQGTLSSYRKSSELALDGYRRNSISLSLQQQL